MSAILHLSKLSLQNLKCVSIPAKSNVSGKNELTAFPQIYILPEISQMLEEAKRLT
jgi:hypothetical protein